MVDGEKEGYYQLSLGHEFPSQSYLLDSQTISNYLEAVKESSDLYKSGGLVPPMAVAALAMGALAASITYPPGTVHVSQELAFLNLVRVGDTITCHSKVSRKVDRGGMHLLSTDLTVFNQNQTIVLTGRVGFVLPNEQPG